VVTEAAVKQHLLRLYQKFRIPEGANRRVRLANEVVALGLVRPLPTAEKTRPTAEKTRPTAEKVRTLAERTRPPADKPQPGADKAPALPDRRPAVPAPSPPPSIPPPASPSSPAVAAAHGSRRTGSLRAATPG
jgi:hypothetical protein